MNNTYRFLLFCLFPCFLFQGCSSLTPAPVKGETHVTYSIKDEFTTRFFCTLRFKKGPRGLLELVVSRQDSVCNPPARRQKTLGLFDTTEPVIVPDADGRVLTSRFLRRRGGSRLSLTGFGPLWLPPHLLTQGNRISLDARFGGAVVDTIITWHAKKLCVVSLGGKESTIAGTGYFSLATGLLYSGSVSNSSTRYYSPDSIATIVLSASNIPGI